MEAGYFIFEHIFIVQNNVSIKIIIMKFSSALYMAKI